MHWFAGLALVATLFGAMPLNAQTVTAANEVGKQNSARGVEDVLAKPARLMVENLSLQASLTRLHDRSGVPIAFSPTLLPAGRTVTCDCENLSVAAALDRLLAGTGFRYSPFRGQILIEAIESDEWAREVPRVMLAGRSSLLAAGRSPVLRVQGAVSGRVVAQSTLRPLAGAQVDIPGTGIETLTNAAGRYSLHEVPAGEVTVRVQLIGFVTAQQTVGVTTGEIAVADFELAEHAIRLDEIVVTGTAGGTQRRAIGNVVERMAIDGVMEVTPSMNVQQAIGSRTPGVSVEHAAGQVGSGGVIRVRGPSSPGLTNDPIIYVDGVRINADPRVGPVARAKINRLNDINPDDIESIEIIKGPAAATLYGTEASSGVIQIITKQGTDGAPTLNLAVRTGATWMQDPAGKLGMTYGTVPETGEIIGHNLYEYEREHGQGDLFQTGLLQTYTGSVRGGTDILHYRLSAEWTDQEGILDYNWHKKASTRMNMRVMPSEKLDISAGFAYVKGTTRLGGHSGTRDILAAMFFGSPTTREGRLRGFFAAPPEVLAEIESFYRVDRTTWNVQLNHRPFSWFHQKLVGGIDLSADETSDLFPRHEEGASYFFGAQSLGVKDITWNKTTFTTVDYSATATFGLTPNLESSTSVGFQHYRNQNRVAGGSGRQFPTPDVTTLGGAATSTATEDFIENRTVGVFVQEQIGWKNRLFVTGAVRADDNSAFGANFEFVTYPKISASWVVDEEPFFNLPGVSSLRLRTALGAAGQQPDVFAAVRLYEPTTGPGDGPVVMPAALGNPDLKPERGEELELGFDAALLDDRIVMNFTYYNRLTRDAIIPRAIPPSRGFPGFQFVNLGEVKNWGTELGVEADVLQRGWLRWALGLTFSRMKNRVESLGDLQVAGTGVQQHRPGYPLGSMFHARVLSAEFVSGDRGEIENEMCDGGPDRNHAPVPCAEAPQVFWGQPTPTWEAGLSSTLVLGNNLQLYARVEGRGGHLHGDGTIEAMQTSVNTTLTANLQNDPIHMTYRKIGRAPLGFYKAGFAKLREVSAVYALPADWSSRFGASRASIAVAGRNLATLWVEQKFTSIAPWRVWDPEIRNNSEFGGRYQNVMPPTAQLVTTIRLTY